MKQRHEKMKEFEFLNGFVDLFFFSPRSAAFIKSFFFLFRMGKKIWFDWKQAMRPKRTVQPSFSLIIKEKEELLFSRRVVELIDLPFVVCSRSGLWAAQQPMAPPKRENRKSQSIQGLSLLWLMEGMSGVANGIQLINEEGAARMSQTKDKQQEV